MICSNDELNDEQKKSMVKLQIKKENSRVIGITEEFTKYYLLKYEMIQLQTPDKVEIIQESKPSKISSKFCGLSHFFSKRR